MKIRTANLLMALAFILLIAGCLFGCKSVQKYKASPQYPADCARDFPVKTIPGKPDTVTLAGYTIDCDSVIKANPPTVVRIYDTDTTAKTPPKSPEASASGRKVPCPPSHTITIRDTVISTAALEACQRQAYDERKAFLKQMQQFDADYSKAKSKLSTRTKQRNWLFFLVLGYAIYYFRHNIFKIFNRLR